MFFSIFIIKSILCIENMFPVFKEIIDKTPLKFILMEIMTVDESKP